MLTNQDVCLSVTSLNDKVDKKAVIRNRYNRIPYPAQNTKRERDTYNCDGTKIKVWKAKRAALSQQMATSYPK